MQLHQPRTGARLNPKEIRSASRTLVGLGSLAAGLLALARPSQGQDALVPLDPQQVLNEDEVQAGVFDGGFSITLDGQTLASADAGNPNANFLAFTIE